MNRVELHGPLAKYGTGFNIDAGSPHEAFHALDQQLRGFRRDFITGNYVAVREGPDGKYLVTEDLLTFNQYGTVIHFTPMVGGASNGKGTAKTILGVAMFVGSFFIPGGPAGAQFLGMSLRTTTMLVGASLALSGISILLAPQIKLGEDKKEDRSFLFGSNSATAGQDAIVPVTYGQDRVRPILIGSELVTNQIVVGLGENYSEIDGIDYSRPFINTY